MATTYRVPSRLEHDVRSARQLVNDSHETAEVVTLTSGSPCRAESSWTPNRRTSSLIAPSTSWSPLGWVRAMSG